MKIHISLLVLLSGGIVSSRTLAQDSAPTTPIVPIPNNAPVDASSGAAPSTPVTASPVPAPISAAPVVAAPVEPESPQIYVIKPGDNPWTIAKNHGISVEELMAANTIKDPKNLRIGDVLNLPKGTAPQAKPEPVVAPAATLAAPGPGDDWEVYTIKKGDNPWNIAKRLKLDHQKIIALNPGVDFGDLKIGQQIRIPKQG